jgi:hypothetical protein
MGLILAASGIGGCDGGPPQITVAGKTIMIKEENFGTADFFCNNLARGQIMVIQSDFHLCDEIKGADGGATGAFHGMEEGNLRLIFPYPPKKVPSVNKFMVGQGDCSTVQAPNTEGQAWFSHNPKDMGKYDVNLQAGSGEIDVDWADPATTNEFTGTYTLNFGSETVSGKFKALRCNGVVPGLGK